jgi:Flp pilus assembly protein TadD
MRFRVLLWISILVFAHWNVTAETGLKPVSTDELLAGTVLELGSPPPAIVENHEVMALNEEMREYLAEHVGRRAGPEVKLKQLAQSILRENVFGLEYDETTRTANEIFETRKGNCLSFTIMFVAMARGAGLDARFQEVDIPHEWTFAEGTFILNRHINIEVRQGAYPPKMVDFNMADFRTEYDTRTIRDERALAHFFNNLGAELTQRGEMAAAFVAFRRALAENDPAFAPAWTSLGTLYARLGHSYHAEAAFLRALEIDRSDLTAMNNLTALYDRRGEPELAQRYRNKVTTYRMQNPYYRFHLARLAYHSGDYDQAIDHLKYATRKSREEDRFHALLGLVYLKMGDEKRSLQSMARAEEVATSNAMKGVYSSKIDRLIASSRKSGG